MSQSTLPLLCRSPLLPDESLPSLLARLTTLNSYSATDILKRLCLNGAQDNLDRPSKAATFERIASLTKLSCQALHAATAHRFAETLTPPGAQIELLDFSFDETVPLLAPGVAFQQLRPASAVQFCPRCLEESAYHRVAWIPMAVAACLQHQCLLLDRCPDCCIPVAVQDIVDAYCHRCRYDLRQSSSASTEGDAWGRFSQRVIQAWLGLVPMPENGSSHPLPDQPPAVLYRLLDGLRWSITGVRAGWKYLHRLPQGALASRLLDPDARMPYQDFEGMSLSFDTTMKPDESYCLYATALKGLVNWPKGFYEFLRAYRLRNVKGLHRRLDADFGDLYSQWLEKHWQSLAFVQKAFHQYLVDNYALSPSGVQSSHCQDDLGLAEGFTYTTVEEAARFLGVSPKIIERLVQAGLLLRYEFPEYLEETPDQFVRRAEVRELRNKWANGISLEDAARYLGLPQRDTLDLVSAGLLFAEHGPEVDGSSHWTFSKQAVTECYSEVAKGLLCFTPGRAIIDLTGAAQMLSAVGLDVTGILQCVTNGELRGYLPGKLRGLGEVMFTKASIRVYLEKVKEERKWVIPKEIARRMGVTEPTLSRWIQAGLLSPVIVCGSACYFDPDAVKEFITGHVFDQKAAEILGVGVDKVRQWTREGQLKPVSGPGVDFYYRQLYRRQDVEQLRRGIS